MRLHCFGCRLISQLQNLLSKQSSLTRPGSKLMLICCEANLQEPSGSRGGSQAVRISGRMTFGAQRDAAAGAQHRHVRQQPRPVVHQHLQHAPLALRGCTRHGQLSCCHVVSHTRLCVDLHSCCSCMPAGIYAWACVTLQGRCQLPQGPYDTFISPAGGMWTKIPQSDMDTGRQNCGRSWRTWRTLKRWLLRDVRACACLDRL